MKKFPPNLLQNPSPKGFGRRSEFAVENAPSEREPRIMLTKAFPLRGRWAAARTSSIRLNA